MHCSEIINEIENSEIELSSEDLGIICKLKKENFLYCDEQFCNQLKSRLYEFRRRQKENQEATIVQDRKNTDSSEPGPT